MFSRRAASEFPNDNPELHDGLVWVCPAPLDRALPTLRLRPIVGALPRVLGPSWEREAEPTNVAEAEPDHAEAEPDHAETEPDHAETPPTVVAAESPESEPSGPFEVFVMTLARIALARGATRAASSVALLLGEARLPAGAVDEQILRSLVARRVVVPAGTQLTPEFRAARDAWRGILTGSVSDLSACGASTLDAWAAELLGAILNLPSGQVAELRRELRRAGIAAFGLLAVA
ncbi:MAG TPA: hypothetical protein VGQ57_05605 [Polyangiaceae bacterium]|nr:hypothetical protein [Polyangiaceae bacterium]